MWLRRARAAHLGARRVRAVRRRHRRLLPDRPDDPRHLARHRRLQRLPHAAVRPRRGRLVRRAVRAVRRAPRRAARAGAQLGRDRHHRPGVVPAASSCRSPGSPATSSRRCSGRPASTWATPSAPTAPGRSSSPTPAPTLERSDAGLLSTAAWRSPDGELTYALEGAIFVTGAAVQWLRDGLQIVGSAAETAAIAATVDDTEGVVFVPALTGLGAPHWDPHARGLIIGITRGTTRAHIVRATLEAIAFEVRDVLETMPDRAGSVAARRRRRRANDLLCQLQADQLGVPVERPEIVETTALGAAFLAGLGTGVWSSTDDLRETWQLDRALRARRRPARPPTPPTPAGSTPSSAPRAGRQRLSAGELRRAPAARGVALPGRRGRDGSRSRLGRVASSASASSSSTRPRQLASSSASRRRAPRSRPAPAAPRPRASATAVGPPSSSAVVRPRPARCLGRRRARSLRRGARLLVGLRVGYDVQLGRRLGSATRGLGREARAPRAPPPRRPRRPRRRRWLRARRPAARCAPPGRSSSSTIAAVRVASTWSATASVTFTPASGGEPPGPAVVTAAVSCRRCRVSARSSSPVEVGLRLPQRRADARAPASTCSASRRTSS